MDLNDREEMLRRVRESAAQDPDTLARMDRMRVMLDGATSIAHIVAAYRVGCIPASAKADQIRETEQAQYAACQMLMKMLMDKVHQGDDAAEVWINSIMSEIDQFAAQRIAVMMGRPGGTA
ncbi:hypothetical protein D3C84_313260 [compost metagenome]